MSFDTSSLVRRPISAESSELVALRRSGQLGDAGGLSPAWVRLASIGLAVVGLLGGLIGLVGALGGDDPWYFRLITFALQVVLPVVAFGMVGPMLLRRMAVGRSWQQLALFARDNGLSFRRRSPSPQYPGIRFAGQDAACIDHVWAAQGTFADAGTLNWGTIDLQQKYHTRRTRYLAFRLARPVPHLLLDARGHDHGLESVAHRMARTQRLPIGGQIEQRFDVFAPRGYGADAYQLLAPDVLELLLAEPAGRDYELVDNWLFVYSNELDPARPETWQEVERLTEGLVARLNRGAGRYRDARQGAVEMAAPGASSIAAQGERLRRRMSPVTKAVIVLVAVVLVPNLAIWGYALFQLLTGQ